MLKDKEGIWISKNSITVSYPEWGNENCFAIEEKSFWFKHRNDVILKIIKKFPYKDNYADIGGGNGFQLKFISEKLSKGKFFLIEPGYIGCLNARKRGTEEVYNVNFEDFPFKEMNVNGIGLYDVIEHIEDDSGFLKKLSEKLPKYSLIYITVPAYKWLWSDNDDSAGHFRRYNTEMIFELAKKSNLEVLYNSYFFSYIVPLTFAFRHIPYKLRRKREGKIILKEKRIQHDPGNFILKIFNTLNKWELEKIEGGITIGASCLAVLKTK